PFVLSEVRVFHVFYFLAGAKFMIIASHCFYVQRRRTSYLNPSDITNNLRGIPNAWHFWFYFKFSVYGTMRWVWVVALLTP
ncbi:hypothetical protein FKN12_18235, partial [Vibrio sp. 2-2(8)]|nr:hypothetical protein [Vibrio sp. 2-2(8)]